MFRGLHMGHIFSRCAPTLALIMGLSLAAHAEDEAALLAAIRANPAEDTPRLVYADWLDEHGDATRAEFIRLQVKAARLPEGSSERIETESKADLILIANQAKWLPKDFGKRLGTTEMKLTWERGFPAELVLPRLSERTTKAIDWLHPPNGLPMLSQLTPLAGTAQEAALPALGHNPLLRLVPSLDLSDPGVMPSELLATLNRADNVRRLELDARDCDSLRDIGRSPNAAHIRALTFRGHGYLSHETLGQILRGEAFPNLEEFNPRGAELSPNMSFFISELRLPRLKRLTLHSFILVSELERFVKTPAFARLQSFSYRGNSVATPVLYETLADRKHSLIELELDPPEVYRLNANAIAKVEAAMQRNRIEQQCTTLALLLSEQ